MEGNTGEEAKEPIAEIPANAEQPATVEPVTEQQATPEKPAEQQTQPAAVPAPELVVEEPQQTIVIEDVPYRPTFDKVILIKDHALRNAYATYKPTWPTLKLESEKNRVMICEDIDETINLLKIPTLKAMAMKLVAEHFRSGDIPRGLSANDNINFCSMIDINLPILYLLQIKNEMFWRRLFETKSKDQALIQSKKDDRKTVFKNLAIQIKFEEILEKADVEGWDIDEMKKLARKLAPYIYELNIKELQSQSTISYERDPNLEKEKVYHYPAIECHHINLSVLGMFYKLHTLVIEFNAPQLVMNYNERFFLFSYVDIENLAKGLVSLHTLKTFKIRRSLMDTTKLLIVLNALKELTVENLEFSFCHLQDECGIVISNFLNTNLYVKSLELRGNYIRDKGMRALSFGIQEYEGKISHLGLAFNPINDNGFKFLARALFNCLQIESLDLAGIEITELGSALVAEIIKNHRLLKHINLVGCPLNDRAGNRVLKALGFNRRIVKLDVRFCNLTIDQDFKMRILINRNIYIKNNPYLYKEGEVLHLMGKTERIEAEEKTEKSDPIETDADTEEEILIPTSIEKQKDSIDKFNEDLNMDPDKDFKIPTDDVEIRNWVARIKNPILLSAMHRFNKEKKCKKLAQERGFGKYKPSESSVYIPNVCRIMEIESESTTSSIDKLQETPSEKFEEKYNEMNEVEFLERVRTAGDCRKTYYKPNIFQRDKYKI